MGALGEGSLGILDWDMGALEECGTLAVELGALGWEWRAIVSSRYYLGYRESWLFRGTTGSYVHYRKLLRAMGRTYRHLWGPHGAIEGCG